MNIILLRWEYSLKVGCSVFNHNVFSFFTSKYINKNGVMPKWS